MLVSLVSVFTEMKSDRTRSHTARRQIKGGNYSITAWLRGFYFEVKELDGELDTLACE